MPQTAESASFKLVSLEGFPEPMLAKHVENGRSGASHGPDLEAELATHDWDVAPCFVITRLRNPAPAMPLPAAPTLNSAAARGAGDEFHRSWAIRAASGLIGAIQRARQRRALTLLDRRLLDDIGVSPEEAQAEARKPPWRP